MRGVAIAGLVMGVLVGAGALAALIQQPGLPKNRWLREFVQQMRKFKELWHAGGMQCKLKLGLGLFQCVSAAPTVFGVSVPVGADKSLGTWLDLLRLPSNIGFEFILPGSWYIASRTHTVAVDALSRSGDVVVPCYVCTHLANGPCIPIVAVTPRIAAGCS